MKEQYLQLNLRDWLRAACVALGFLTVSIFAAPAFADHLVDKHELSCGNTFPCPPEIRRRVDFWIQVFSKWSSRNIVFHDPERPERVYSVMRSRTGCSKKKSSSVRREYAKVEGDLRKLAAKLEKGNKKYSSHEVHLMGLFPNARASHFRAAAGRIRCQQGNKDRFEEALGRYGAYGDMVRAVLTENRLSSDIQYLPFVESGYNPAAYSRVGAAGMWQIMPATARGLGLDIGSTLDERLDPEAATRAAAKYLIDSQRSLSRVARANYGNVADGKLNPFIITSYNYGVSGMRRALREIGPDFIKVLNNYKSPRFQVAVKNFYASFLAARHVAKNSKRYFGRVRANKPLQYQTVLLRRKVSLARILDVFDVNEKKLKELNPALTRYVWHEWRAIPQGYRLRLPAKKDGWSVQAAKLDALPVENEAQYAKNYKVKKGDTACGIARAFGVSCRKLMSANNLGKRGVIKVGQRLIIPGQARPKTQTATGGGVPIPAKYKVQRGDTACGIAVEFNISCQELVKLNRLGRRAVIRVGQILRIPGGEIQLATTTQAKTIPSVHTVKAGDTACTVAARYAVSCKELIAQNKLSRKAVIRIGQKLKLPGGGEKAEQAVALTAVEKPVSYSVRKGDTPCAIARKHELPCDEFLAFNNLSKRSVIQIGQILKLPKQEAVATVPINQTQHTVRRGETPCAIAERYDIECANLMSTNNLTKKSLIQIGQILIVPVPEPVTAAPLQVAAAVETEIEPDDEVKIEEGESTELNDVLDKAIDLRVQTGSKDGKISYYVTVESSETLGHYADWLGIGTSHTLRKINGLSRNRAVRAGERLDLPIKTAETLESFQRKRQEYHRLLVEEFKERFEIVGLESYSLRAGDSPWKISQRFQLPVWLLIRFNPGLRHENPGINDVLSIPQVRARAA